MTILQALILSFVEGITEFLPVSSTGHLILASHLMAIRQTEFVKTFEIFIQFGAILAVITVYAQILLKKSYLWKNLLFAFLPAGVLGFVLYKIVKGLFLENPWITVVSFIVGGFILLLFEKFIPKKQSASLESLSPFQAILIGIGQSVAIIPGVSRSAASIISGMMVGLSRAEAVEFSFLLAVPTIAAASFFDLFQTTFTFQSDEFFLLGIGSVASFIFALITIKYFLAFIKHHSFVPFGIYRIALGLLFLLFL